MGNVHNIKNTSKRSGTAYISKIEVYTMWNQTTKCLNNQGRTKGEGWSNAN